MDRVKIEVTSKPLKLAQVVVVLSAMVCVGVGVFVSGERGVWVGGIGCAGAGLAYCVVRLLMWWEHG